MSNTQSGHKRVMSGIYKIQYKTFFSDTAKLSNQLPALAHKLPPKAKVVKMRANCHQFTFHLFLSFVNMRANVRTFGC